MRKAIIILLIFLIILAFPVMATRISTNDDNATEGIGLYAFCSDEDYLFRNGYKIYDRSQNARDTRQRECDLCLDGHLYVPSGMSRAEYCERYCAPLDNSYIDVTETANSDGTITFTNTATNYSETIDPPSSYAEVDEWNKNVKEPALNRTEGDSVLGCCCSFGGTDCQPILVPKSKCELPEWTPGPCNGEAAEFPTFGIILAVIIIAVAGIYIARRKKE